MRLIDGATILLQKDVGYARRTFHQGKHEDKGKE
jgi:hypothetical protein